MDEVAKLEHLSLVSKVCTELDNHLGLNDKDLAEFIIDIADKNPAFDSFKKALIENGAEFSDSFMTNLLRIIQHMKPSNTTQKAETSQDHSNPLANKFPGLAIPNEKPPKFSSDEESEEEDEKSTKRLTAKEIFKEESKADISDSVVDQAMAELEALAPSQGGPGKESKKDIPKEDIKKRERSHSRDRKDVSRRRERSRERDRDRKSRRSRSRDKRSSSRDRRSRSRDRRSRSRGRRSRSRNRDRDRRKRSRSRPTSSRHRSRDRQRRSKSRGRTSPSRGRSSPARGKRSPSREREHKYDYGKKSRKRSPEVEMSDDPEPGKIYNGRVANIVPFGCFVQIEGVRKRWEGLVHISQLRSEGRVTNVSDVVNRGDKVKVKVISVTGQKVSLTMKDVCQETGKDLNPTSHAHLEAEREGRNPDRPPPNATVLAGLQGGLDPDEDSRKESHQDLQS